MPNRLALAAALASAAFPAHASLLLLGAGPAVDSSVAYAPLGVQFLVGQLISNASAMSGIAASCQGTAAVRLKGMSANNSVGPTLLNDQLFATWTPGIGGSEVVPGINFSIDNGGATNGNVRLNFGDAAHNTGSETAGDYSIVEGVYVDATEPFANDRWNSYVMSWNLCSSPGNVAVYQMYAASGVQVTNLVATGSGSGTFPIEVAYNYDGGTATTRGFAIGQASGSTLLGNSAYFDIDDLVIDTAHSVVTASNTIPAAALAAYFSGGAPVRVNAAGQCSGLTGYAASICFTTDGGGATPSYSVANFQTNQGTGGGSFALTGGPLAPASVPPAGVAAGGVAQLWTTGAGPDLSSASSFATAYDQHRITAGDLLLMAVNISSSTVYASCPSGWTVAARPSAAQAYWSGASNTTTLCWRVATASETAPTVTLSASFSGYIGWSIADYVGVDGTAPIDTYSGLVNWVASLTQPSANTTTSYAGDLVVEFVTTDMAGGSSIATPPSGTSLRANYNGSASGGSISIFDAVEPAAGLTAFGGMTLATGGSLGSTAGHQMAPTLVAVALKPAATSTYALASGTYGLYGAGTVRLPGTTASTICAGAGGDGGGYSSSQESGGGGGGYSESDGLTPGAALAYYSAGFSTSITASTGSTPAGTWINLAGTQAAPSSAANGCVANAGTGGGGVASPAGASTTGAIGTVETAGGAGAGYSSSPTTGGGGGGAGGSGGAGSSGTVGSSGGAGGAGGGGAHPGGAGGTGFTVNTLAQTVGGGALPGGGGGGAGTSGTYDFGGKGGWGRATFVF